MTTLDEPAKPKKKATNGKNGRRTATAQAPSRDAGGLSRRELLAALRSLKRGDFDAHLPEDHIGLDGEICEAFNDLVQIAAQLREEASTVESGVKNEGRTRRRLRRNAFGGGWRDVVNHVNDSLDEMADHADQMAKVIGAVRNGDLKQTIDLEGEDQPLRGDFRRHALAVNDMVAQLSHFGSEVTRVAQEVGVAGELGAQAKVPGVSGTWKELTDSVNLMASNLTAQVREIARVTTAVAQGDLSQTVNIEVRGEILELKNTINTMVAQLGSFADEVTRMARQVGTEGILGGQAQVRGVSGTWRELTENVNSMANNLTLQVRNIAEVSSAIASGDLSRKITVEVKGEMLELKNTINTMVDQLSSFADEVTRVAREVGTEGVLGGQAQIKGVSGTWRELTDNVNSMAQNLTGQVRNIAEVVTAIAEGDLGRKITVDARGEILQLKNTINSTVDKLNHFAAEVTRVARLVGTEGTLGVQAEVRDVSGIWKELTDNVNTMGRNLTDQVRDIAEVTTAVAHGDLSKKITVESRGEILQLKNTMNDMVDSLGSFADEVTRMAREVGTEGVLGGQASVRDAKGIWKELTDNVNSMANNLTNQVRNIAEVATSVASGDLSRKITVGAKGEVLDLKNTLNAMVDQLNAFASEVTRVAREVGVEGKLGGQAEVAGVRGTWKELTDNVNFMATNLTNQVRDIAEVTTGVANGDLSRKIVVDARGEILELKNTINTMVDQLNAFASEVTRLASDVGIEGKLGGQADVRGVSGTWRDLTDAVNSMANNLTEQVRNIALVAGAIAEGDLQQKIVVDARGEILELKNTINTMVDQLNGFGDEVTRVARDVGVEGKLGGQAQVRGVRGTWKELTDNVNMMASNLTNQVRDISQVSTAIASGDLSRKITVEVRGELLELKNTINTMVDQLSGFADEVTRVARDVGVEGKLGGQADVRGVSGIWKELTDNVNMMSSSLTNQVRDIAEVTTAVAQGDLSRKITVEVRGEILELKNTINTMVDQLSSFADEVTRVAREVGTEGVLGGQAEVRGVSGTWRELTDNVNVMGRNLTEQVRGIARVVTAVANGNLRQELKLDTKGEIAALVGTINGMVETLSVFADQVSGVARDVGFEGKLGGQANVPGAAGIWRDLTSNVNELAGNLTRQVRAIGDVATAVTKGDLTQSIDVEARGEVAMLKDNINQMIFTLAETTRVNQEQDWLKTNLAQFTRMLQGQRELLTVADQVLSQLAPVVEAQHGAFYVAERDEDDDMVLKLFASYAFNDRRRVSNEFRLGEGLVGQAARERKRITIADLPDDYIRIGSALGEATPKTIVVVPIQYEGSVKGVIELASFKRFTPIQLAFLDQLLESLGIVVATIEATMRTDELLRQSQGMAVELRTQQEELKLTNDELEQQARALKAQRDQVERKNQEVELARAELEEKAEQLSLTSKYKSQFLANMSHELRTPLNSLLILSRQLAENKDGNLSARQVEFAETIHHSGADLLSLISEILDLAKIESGTMALHFEDVALADVAEFVSRSFRHVAEDRHLAFSVEIDRGAPPTVNTDDMRLKQVLRNLLSNAFKFTEHGSVKVLIEVASAPDSASAAGEMLAFTVIDTGIGIPLDKQRIIFEAFQQADGGTSRRYGGTGLGLSISREIASLLGGRIRVESQPGQGSRFTLYVPIYKGAPRGLPTPNSPLRRSHVAAALPRPAPAPDDDRERIGPGERAVLIVEDDPAFGRVVLEAVRERGMLGILATDGETALALARRHKPQAITLDIVLPEMDGWALLDRLKHDPETSHIPVHVMSAVDADDRAKQGGAVAVIHKPVDRTSLDALLAQLEAVASKRMKRLLVVEDDEATQRSVTELLRKDDLSIESVSTAEDALTRLNSGTPPDCLIVDLRLPGMTGQELIAHIKGSGPLKHLPVIIYTGRELSPEEGETLQALADGVVAKDGRSADRLLIEVGVHLSRALDSNLVSRASQRSQRDDALQGRTVLIVDDDMRNIYALTALCEGFGMTVHYAEHGKQALERLAEHPGIDVVLMDIMMPEMDGYEAMRRIRESPSHKKLPIIALTAKAMKGDRDKCIEAGASDYVTKPIDREQLFSLMLAWLFR